VVQIISGLVQLGSGVGMLSLASSKIAPAWFKLAQVFVPACSEVGRLKYGWVRLASGSVKFLFGLIQFTAGLLAWPGLGFSVG
jgi:hypothetical protein